MALVLPGKLNTGAQLGSAFGTGLGNILQGLAQGQQRQALGGQLQQQGLPSVLAHLDPQVQAAYLKEFGSAQQAARQQLVQDMANEEIINALQGVRAPSPGMPQDASSLQQMLQQQLGAPSARQTQQPQFEEISEQIRQEDITTPSEQSFKTAADVPVKYLDKAASGLPSVKRSDIARRKAEIDAFDRILSNPRVSDAAKIKVQDRREKVQDRFDSKRDRLFDKTEKVRSALTDGGIRSSEMLDVINRNLEIVKGGGMDTPSTMQAYKNLGLDTAGLLENDTQEFIKNNGIFLKNMRELFGGNITQGQSELFMKTIANEYQSPEGQRRVLESFKKMAKAGMVRFDAMNSIIEANGGVPTETLQSDIESIAKPELLKIKKEYLAELKRAPLPTTESTFKAVAKTAGSKLAGGLSEAVLPAILGIGGAVLGGPVGAAAGVGAGSGSVLRKLYSGS